MDNQVLQYKVTVRDQKEVRHILCSANENLFKALIRNGFFPSGGCGGGGCGICKVKITSGTFTTRRMSASRITAKDREENILLACCVIPTGDIEVDINGF